MKLGEFQIDARKPERKPSPMLVIFADPEDQLMEQCVIDFLFRESYQLSQHGKNVQWIRSQPSTSLPHIDEDVLLNPKWLDRISLRYDSGRPHSAIVQFCCKDIYKMAITPYCLFVELIDPQVSLPEFASMLALLSHTSRWIASKRPTDADSFTVVTVVRNIDDFRMRASLFSDYLVQLNGRTLTNIV